MNARRPLLVGMGEVLWDLLPGGRQLGGAPANFGYHAHALGAEARIISAVGGDQPGQQLLERLAALGLATEFIQTVDRPTGTVSVKLDKKRQPEFTIHEHVAWDAINADNAALECVAQCDAVCFGTLAQRSDPSRQTVRTLVKRAKPRALKVLDVNLRQDYYSKNVLDASLRLANVLKINEDELTVIAEMAEISGSPRDQLRELAELYQLSTVILTRGEAGSLIVHEGASFEHPGVPTETVDTVGAGDAFTAATTLGLLAGWSLEMISNAANELAAYVCTQPGATPPLPDKFRRLFETALAG